MIDGIFAALVLETPTCDLYGRASDETQRAMVELFAVEVVQCDTVATGDARRFTRTPGNAIRFDRKAARATGDASTQCTGIPIESTTTEVSHHALIRRERRPEMIR
ncbi:hypothetical protein [Caballeronia arationis]|jgi:hypothetical protein|uniref:hypothetical protein n=1 Tax=Caballeronia arationis TaxID=1777142 RepID=UPI00141E6C51|nr:hypothetical protein [Caballeronia arationis]